MSREGMGVGLIGEAARIPYVCMYLQDFFFWNGTVPRGPTVATRRDDKRVFIRSRSCVSYFRARAYLFLYDTLLPLAYCRGSRQGRQ